MSQSNTLIHTNTSNRIKLSGHPFYDVDRVRRDFRYLTSQTGRAPVYLDSAATSQKPQQVLDAIVDFYVNSNANVHRSVYRRAEEATNRYESARGDVARFVGGASSGKIIFVRNATEAINLVARAWGDANVLPGDEILVTEMEHHSNLVPWHQLARRTGCVVKAISINEDGTLDIDSLDRLIGARTRLVAVAHVSNVLGTVNPVAQIVLKAHAVGAKVLVDAAQSVPHMPVSVTAMNPDFFVASGHKMLGPMGAGFLWVSDSVIDDLPPFMGGGEMIREVTLADSTYAEPPARFEAGTPDVAAAVGLGEAVRYLQELGMSAVSAHTRHLGSLARSAVESIPGVTVFGPRPGPLATGSVLSFAVPFAHPHDIASGLDEFGVEVRAGHHCAQPLMARLGVPATTRASFGPYNTEAEVFAFASALDVVLSRYRVVSHTGHVHQKDEQIQGYTGDGHHHSHDEISDDELFREVVFDHYSEPYGRKPLDRIDVEVEGRNPLCGDHVILRLKINVDLVEDVQVDSVGCSVSVASGSMLAEKIKGRTVESARRLMVAMRSMLRGEELEAGIELGDLQVLEGIRDLPVRVKCALLPWTTLADALTGVPKDGEKQ